MRNARVRAAIVSLALIVPHFAFAKDLDWPEAVGRLARERSLAETCAASLKGHGSAEQIAKGQMTYGEAKSSFDAAIAGLIIALGEGESPKALPDLQADLASGASALQGFCETVAANLPSETGQKSVVEDMLKAAVEPVVNALSEAVAALYNNHRSDNALTRSTIKTQLEAAKWPDFADIGAAK